jgi:hypothetical protein
MTVMAVSGRPQQIGNRSFVSSESAAAQGQRALARDSARMQLHPVDARPGCPRAVIGGGAGYRPRCLTGPTRAAVAAHGLRLLGQEDVLAHDLGTGFECKVPGAVSTPGS